jgi:hypothetical protein
VSEFYHPSGLINQSVAYAEPKVADGFEGKPALAGHRVFYLDNLRILLTALVVVHHAAITYGNIPIWYYTEPASDPSGKALDLLVIFNQTFFMGFFFLIAGYFVPGSYDRKGSRAFMRDRWVRLGIPLLVFLVVLRPILMAGLYPKVRAAFAEQGLSPPFWVLYLITWDPGPLWFVEVLLVFSLVYAMFRKRRGGEVESQSSPPAAAGAWAPTKGAVLGFALLLTFITYLWRFIVPIGQYWPFVGLPTPYYLPQYTGLFVIGLLAYRRGWLQAVSSATGWFGLAMAAVASAVLLPLMMNVEMIKGAGHGTWQSMVGALWESLFAVGVIVALLVLFRDRLDVQGRLGRFLSEQTYAVYVIHPLVLVGLGHAFAWLSAIAVVKFAIMSALGLPLCWIFAYVVRSPAVVRRVL